MSSKVYFWLDELLTHLFASDASLIHMLGALGDQMDQSLPLYHVLMWYWTAVFGYSELAMRLLSAGSVMGAVWVMWIVLRQHFSLWASAFGTAAAFCFSVSLTQYVAEARCYGLFLLLCSLTILSYLVLVRERTPSRRALCASALVHGGLVLTHVFGFLYSGTVLLCLAARDLSLRNYRPRVYLSVLAGWLCFLPWGLGPFRRQLGMSFPRSWVPVPSATDLFPVLNNGISIAFVLVVLCLLAVVTLKGLADRPLVPRVQQQRTLAPLILLAAAFVIVPPTAAWVISQVVVSIFYFRYLLPGVLGWAILLALCAQLFVVGTLDRDKELFSSRLNRAAALAAFALLVLAPVAMAVRIPRSEVPGSAERPYFQELPIVLQSPHAWWPRFHYDKQREYFCIVDLEVALAKRSALNSPQDYKLLRTMKRHYNFPGIVETNQFLQDHDRFLVLKERGRRWSEMRLESNPAYRITPLRKDLLLVEKSQR